MEELELDPLQMDAAPDVTPSSDDSKARQRQHSFASSLERSRFVVLRGLGLSVEEIAQETGRHRVTVRRWLERFQEEGEGGLRHRARCGRKRTTNAEEDAALVQVARAEPQIGLSDAAAAAGVRCSSHTVAKRLIESGLHRYVPSRSHLSAADEQARQRLNCRRKRQERDRRKKAIQAGLGSTLRPVVPEKAGTDNNPREAEYEDVRQIKSEPEDGNCNDRANVLPGNDCDSESVSGPPGVERDNRPSVVTDMRLYKCDLCDYSSEKNANLKRHLTMFHRLSGPSPSDLRPLAFQQKSHLVAPRGTLTKDQPPSSGVRGEPAAQPCSTTADHRLGHAGKSGGASDPSSSGSSSSTLRRVVPEKAGTDNNPSEAESEDVSQIKSEPEDGNCDDRANVLPGNDCDSESVSGPPGVERDNRPSDIVTKRLYKCDLCDYSSEIKANLKRHLTMFHRLSGPSPSGLRAMAFRQKSHLVAPRGTLTKDQPPSSGVRGEPAAQPCSTTADHRLGHAGKSGGASDAGGSGDGTVSAGVVGCGPEAVIRSAHCPASPQSESEQNPDPVATETPVDQPEPRAGLCLAFVCAFCASLLTSPRELAEHSMTHAPKKLRVTCALCLVELPWRRAAVHHERSHAKEGMKSYRCSACSKDFVYQTSLKRHVAVAHRSNFTYRCDRCWKAFVSPIWHERHVRTCLGTPSEEALDQQDQLSRIEYVQFETVSEDVFSAESATGTRASADPLALD